MKVLFGVVLLSLVSSCVTPVRIGQGQLYVDRVLYTPKELVSNYHDCILNNKEYGELWKVRIYCREQWFEPFSTPCYRRNTTFSERDNGKRAARKVCDWSFETCKLGLYSKGHCKPFYRKGKLTKPYSGKHVCYWDKNNPVCPPSETGEVTTGWHCISWLFFPYGGGWLWAKCY